MVLNPTLLLIYSAFYSRKMVIHCHLFMTIHSPDHMHKSHTGIPKFQMFSATTNSQDPCHFTDRFLWISAKTILKRIKAILGKIPREYRSVHYSTTFWKWYVRHVFLDITHSWAFRSIPSMKKFSHRSPETQQRVCSCKNDMSMRRYIFQALFFRVQAVVASKIQRTNLLICIKPYN